MAPDTHRAHDMNAQATDSTDVDVLISGYGPTGATLANLLGGRGWRVLVIDQAAAIYDKPRAITADQEVFRILQECGIAQEVAETTPAPELTSETVETAPVDR